MVLIFDMEDRILLLNDEHRLGRRENDDVVVHYDDIAMLVSLRVAKVLLNVYFLGILLYGLLFLLVKSQRGGFKIYIFFVCFELCVNLKAFAERDIDSLSNVCISRYCTLLILYLFDFMRKDIKNSHCNDEQPKYCFHVFKFVIIY